MYGSLLLARHLPRTTPTQGSKSFRSGPQFCLWLVRLAVRCLAVLVLVRALRLVVRLARLQTRLRLLRLLKRLLARLVLVQALRLVVGLVPLAARLLVARSVARLVALSTIRDRLVLPQALLVVAWVAILAWAVD